MIDQEWQYFLFLINLPIHLRPSIAINSHCLEVRWHSFGTNWHWFCFKPLRSQDAQNTTTLSIHSSYQVLMWWSLCQAAFVSRKKGLISMFYTLGCSKSKGRELMPKRHRWQISLCQERTEFRRKWVPHRVFSNKFGESIHMNERIVEVKKQLQIISKLGNHWEKLGPEPKIYIGSHGDHSLLLEDSVGPGHILFGWCDPWAQILGWYFIIGMGSPGAQLG